MPVAMSSAETQNTITRGHACITCSQRKVKCDGKRPCSACVRSGRASDCHSASTATSLAARIRDARAKELVLIRRLRHYESLLTAHGISFSNSEPSAIVSQGDGPQDGCFSPIQRTKLDSPPSADEGHVIRHRGHPRFVDNIIWNSLRDELPEDDYYSVLDGEDEETLTGDEQGSLTPESLLFCQVTPPGTSPDETVPSIPQILKLWQIFLDNFNPLVKLFHAPTVQLIVHQAVVDSGSLGRSQKALLRAIFQCAAVTLTDDMCIAQLNESREVVLSRYSAATKQALVRADFLKSTDRTTLQALTLYLLAIRDMTDEQSLWILTGTARRLAQAMGLHREQSLKNCSHFEAELRRRLWWQIVVSDHQAGRMIGVSSRDVPGPYTTDTKRPVNINDSDLYQEMKEPPTSRNYPTEMIFCALRYEIGLCMSQLSLGPSDQTLARKLELINECEKKVQATLSQCDLSIPLHLLTTLMGRSAIGQFRFNTLLSAARNSNDNSPETAAKLFGLALEVLDEMCLALSSPSLKRFHWHMRGVHPFQFLILVLKHLLAHPGGDEVPRAWATLNRMFEHRPDLVNDVKTPLSFASGSLVLKAWNKCCQDAARHALVESQVIIELEKQRAPLSSRTAGPEFDAAGVLSSDSFTNMGLWAPSQQGLMDAAFSGTSDQDFSHLLSGNPVGAWDLQSDTQLEGLPWPQQQ
ncbi:C6 transcription factor domain containing protein [Rhypophila sp. PSN 637]